MLFSNFLDKCLQLAKGVRNSISNFYFLAISLESVVEVQLVVLDIEAIAAISLQKLHILTTLSPTRAIVNVRTKTLTV